VTLFRRISSIVGLSSIFASAAGADTAVSGDLFQASLTGKWSQVSARPDLYVYRRATDGAQITFSSLFSKELMPIDQQRETLLLLTDKHRAAQLRAGPSTILSEVELSESKLRARFAGNDARNHLRAATMLLSGPRGVVIIYFEVSNPDLPTLESEAQKLFASVRLTQ
jgi:hypothetical protein